MPDYKLRVSFTKDQLDLLYMTGTNLVMGKPNDQGGLPVVAWQVIKPLATNEANWNDAYGIYVSSSRLVHGAVLHHLSNVPLGAAMDQLYTLDDHCRLTGSAFSLQECFKFLNRCDWYPQITAGLYQPATINRVDKMDNAVTAHAVAMGQSVDLRPAASVYLWLQGQIAERSVVTSRFNRQPTLLTFHKSNELSVAYDDATGNFVAR